MRKEPVMKIGISSEMSMDYVFIDLSATYYQLRHAITRFDPEYDGRTSFSIMDCSRFPFLRSIIGAADLYALNTLAEKLSTLDEWQVDAFEGLVLMEEEKKGPIVPQRLYDLAASTEECHVLYEVKNDEALGHFYVDNDFVPETEGIPEALYELLDYAKIGRQYREGEGGVFLHHGKGYVVLAGEIREEFKDLDLTPKEPDYTVLMEVAVPDTGITVMLKLPCGPAELETVPDLAGVDSWDELTWRCADCRAPSLADAFSTVDDIALMNNTAGQLLELTGEDVKKLEVLADTFEADRLDAIAALIDRLGEYVFTTHCRTYRECAEHFLRDRLEPEEVSALLPHLNLNNYVRSVLERDGSVLTSYGLLEHRDEQPPIRMWDQGFPHQGGMEMR